MVLISSLWALAMIATCNGQQPFQKPISLNILGISNHRRLPSLPTCNKQQKQHSIELLPQESLLNIVSAEDEWTELLPSDAYDRSWSYPPFCFQKGNSTLNYCLFTSKTFAQNRGISILASPSHAPRLLEHPAFTDPHALKEANNFEHQPYIQQSLPGRGEGVIANTTISKGSVILYTTPVLLIEEELYNHVPPSIRLVMQEKAIANLPPKTRELYMNLSYHKGTNKIEEIINTNSFEVSLFSHPTTFEDGTPFIAVLPENSRMNHACRPNAGYAFNPTTLTQTVLALRPIAIGEELSISYIDIVMTRAARQAALKDSWGFQCTCSACSAHPSLVDASDERITQIHTLQKVLLSRKRNDEMVSQGIGMARMLVSLYEVEGMYAPVSEAYGLAALEANGGGDEWEARRWGGMAVEAGILYAGGLVDGDVSDWKQLAENPREHWSWEFRVRGMGKGEASGVYEEDEEEEENGDGD